MKLADIGPTNAKDRDYLAGWAECAEQHIAFSRLGGMRQARSLGTERARDGPGESGAEE